MSRFFPCILRLPLRVGAATAVGIAIIATAVPGAFGEAGGSGRDQAQQALKQVQANAAAIHHAADQAKGLSGKANAAAQHARDAADKAANQADQVRTEAGDYAAAYVELAEAVATVTADAAAAEAAAQSARAGADSAATAAGQLLQYTSLVNDAVQQTTLDVKTADQDSTAVTDATNQAAVSDQWASDSTTQFATVQTGYSTATQSQLDATTAQQTTQTDAASSTTVIRAAYRTLGAGLTPIPTSTETVGSTTETGGTTEPSGSTSDAGNGGNGSDVADGPVSSSSSDSAPTDAPPAPPAPPTESSVTAGMGSATTRPIVRPHPTKPASGTVMVPPVGRATARGPVFVALTIPATTTALTAVTGPEQFQRTVVGKQGKTTNGTAARSPGSRVARLGRQRPQSAPVGSLDHPLRATDLGAVPTLTVLLLVESLILGRRLAVRHARPRAGHGRAH